MVFPTIKMNQQYSQILLRLFYKNVSALHWPFPMITTKAILSRDQEMGFTQIHQCVCIYMYKLQADWKMSMKIQQLMHVYKQKCRSNSNFMPCRVNIHLWLHLYNSLYHYTVSTLQHFHFRVSDTSNTNA